MRRGVGARGVLGLEPEPRFQTNAQRVIYRETLSERIAARTRGWDRESLLEKLEEVGVPAGPINTVADAFAHPQIRHRGMWLEIERPGCGTVPGVRLPIRFSDAALPETHPAPTLAARSGAGFTSHEVKS